MMQYEVEGRADRSLPTSYKGKTKDMHCRLH